MHVTIPTMYIYLQTITKQYHAVHDGMFILIEYMSALFSVNFIMHNSTMVDMIIGTGLTYGMMRAYPAIQFVYKRLKETEHAYEIMTRTMTISLLPLIGLLFIRNSVDTYLLGMWIFRINTIGLMQIIITLTTLLNLYHMVNERYNNRIGIMIGMVGLGLVQRFG
jgi:hypothetical protein